MKAGPVVFYAVEVALEFIVTVRASGVKTGKCYKYLLVRVPHVSPGRVIYVVSSTVVSTGPVTRPALCAVGILAVQGAF